MITALIIGGGIVLFFLGYAAAVSDTHPQTHRLERRIERANDDYAVMCLHRADADWSYRQAAAIARAVLDDGAARRAAGTTGKETG